MSTERMQILEMLAQGKITPADAERLLDKIGSGPAPNSEEAEPGPAADPDRGRKIRFFCIKAESSDGEHVNIRIPLAFVRAGIKLSTILPKGAGRQLEAKGIDLSHLNGLQGEQLMEALRELNINVDSTGGDTVRICCE